MSRPKSHRANYYTDKSWWITRKARKLFMRFPSLEQFILLAFLFSMVAIPFTIKRNQLSRKRRELSDDEWADYKQRHNAVIEDRVKYGQHLYIPFYNSDSSQEQDEKAQKSFVDS
ncbi:hypothetical protein GPALN_005614 [Globodera pallida]|uniref:Uncharacterized protein n=1 Tax=Globodera pallida TaxID=36090 RepID=A0A183BSV4_GLOPA|nr:hypothetical protein GPALN_005614 [Globodera pallida]